MQKNNKGVTLLILSITIIVIFILSAVSFDTGYTVLRNVRVGRTISNMKLIQIKVEDIAEDAEFSEDEQALVGLKNGEATTYSLAEIDAEIGTVNLSSQVNDVGEWYKWDSSILQSQGLDTKILKEGGCFFVNYETYEVIYSEGETIDNIHYYYSLSAIEEAFENDENKEGREFIN